MSYLIDLITNQTERVYEPLPIGRKSFYGKCKVYRMKDGTEYLKSYDTIVMRRDPDGTLHRTWGGWSATTGRHVVAFGGPGKAEWDKMEVEHA